MWRTASAIGTGANLDGAGLQLLAGGLLNQRVLFGSASNGRGKACKNQRTLYLLRSGEFVPIQISLPPTSLTPYNSFLLGGQLLALAIDNAHADREVGLVVRQVHGTGANQISLPPTSLTPYNSFYNAAFARRQRPLYSSIVRIGLPSSSSPSGQ